MFGRVATYLIRITLYKNYLLQFFNLDYDNIIQVYNNNKKNSYFTTNTIFKSNKSNNIRNSVQKNSRQRTIFSPKKKLIYSNFKRI